MNPMSWNLTSARIRLILIIVSITGLYIILSQHGIIFRPLWGKGSLAFENYHEPTSVEILNMMDRDLLQNIKDNYIIPPPKFTQGLPSYLTDLKDPKKSDYSQVPGTTALIRKYLPHQNGFFVEAGAHDGEEFSTTLTLEKDFQWTGLLIEPNPETFDKLKKKRRIAWISNTCLSPTRQPQKVKFDINLEEPSASRVDGMDNEWKSHVDENRMYSKNITCFPLFSILSAINIKSLDFLSLDVEGAEDGILTTIPFDYLYIKVMLIERWPNLSVKPLVNFMKNQGYRQVDFPLSPENFLFVHQTVKESQSS